MKIQKLLRLATRSLAMVVFLLSMVPTAVYAQSLSQQRLAQDIETLVGFGTRHTNSLENDPVRGIGAARLWAEAEMGRISQSTGGRFIVAQIPHQVQPIDRPRVSKEQIFNVVAILPGRVSGPGRPPAVVLGAHLDSMPSDGMDSESDAPGANDDGSGVAVVLETMRRLGSTQHDATLIFALFTGEEQGLVGSKYLAAHLLREYDLKAMLNLDIVGSSTGRLDTVPGISDQVDTHNTVRCYSTGPNGSASRRWAQRLHTELSDAVPHAVIELIPQSDRPNRGGDHLSFANAGVPAARFIQKYENMAHQHQDVRTQFGIDFGDVPRHLDFAYMEVVADLTTAALAIGQP